MKLQLLSRRVQIRHLFILFLALIAFLITAISALASDCVEIVPYKRLGALTANSPTPSSVLNAPVKEDPRLHAPSYWYVAGPYRFRTGKDGRLDYLQLTLQGQAACLSIGGRRISAQTTLAELRKELPDCAFYPGIPVDQLQCEGFLLLLSTGRERRILRADVSEDSPAKHDAERARWAVEQDLRLWWPKKAASPFSR